MPYPYNKKNVEKLIRIIKEHKELQSHKLDEYTKQRAERQRETKGPVLILKVFINVSLKVPLKISHMLKIRYSGSLK